MLETSSEIHTVLQEVYKCHDMKWALQLVFYRYGYQIEQLFMVSTVEPDN